jgi:D-alanyl-D-alanine carboxypeptidase
MKTPIASISKLMTALVFLDHNPGWDFVHEIKPEDRREGGKIYLTPGEKVKVKDLFYSSLVASDNIATMALVGSAGMTEDDFVAKMNEKAAALELKDTHFGDPLGLDDANISTALEVARFAQAALSNEEIKKATLTKKYEFTTADGKKKTVYNTDNLLSIFPKDGVDLRGGKTGYTEAAGYCFVGEFTNQDGRDVISVVLGSGGKDDRFKFTSDMIRWIYDNYVW